MFIDILSLTSALCGGGCSKPRPGRFTPRKDPVSIVQEAGCAPGSVWTGADNLAPTGIPSPNRPSRSQSLYRLSYSVSASTIVTMLTTLTPAVRLDTHPSHCTYTYMLMEDVFFPCMTDKLRPNIPPDALPALLRTPRLGEV